LSRHWIYESRLEHWEGLQSGSLYLRLKDKSLQAVQGLFSLLLLQIAISEVLQPDMREEHMVILSRFFSYYSLSHFPLCSFILC